MCVQVEKPCKAETLNPRPESPSPILSATAHAILNMVCVQVDVDTMEIPFEAIRQAGAPKVGSASEVGGCGLLTVYGAGFKGLKLLGLGH